MSTNIEEALARFRRRARDTDEPTLRRNIEAGVYGLPGARSRAVAERVLAERIARSAEAMWLARRDDAAGLAERAERAEAIARRATWISALAFVVALVALALRFGAA
jgi:hypothetical protein